MGYVCELGTGRKLYLDNQAGQTVVTLANTASGQQQQASSSFQTGPWIATPEVYLTADGAVVKLQSARGAHYIRVQGGSIGVSEAFSLDSLQHMQMQQTSTSVPPTPPMSPIAPMTPMTPMPPMPLGNAAMGMNPMEMQMGNMQMRMGNNPPPATVSNPPAATTPHQRRFCSQCGNPVKPEDRFCTSCGHHLGD